MTTMPKIVFVCSSNRTRSPMAAAYFRNLLDKAGMNDYEVDSAGLRAQYHGTICKESIEALAAEGIEPLRLGVQKLLPKLIKSADLLVCMTRDQLREIRKTYISAANKTITLMSVLHLDVDVFDPNKQPLQRHTTCLNMMKPALNALAKRIGD